MTDPGKRVQLAGADNAEFERTLVGLRREMRVDVGNQSLRLHDGVAEGGYEFLNRDSSDARYQRRSLELDGFSFGAQEKGWLVRVSPSNYKLRKITVNSANLTLTNPRGTAGDPLFSLAPTITSDHQWDGNQTYSQPIKADGGVLGNLTGDSTGHHNGDVTGNVVGNLEGNAHGNATGTFTGNVDVRGHTVDFDSGQIPLDALGATVHTEFVHRGVPYGAIIMWAGASADIPESWILCNGENGTPNLRDRFVIGAGGTKSPGDLGGSNSTAVNGTIIASGAHVHQVNVADHALTVAELPAHHHHNGVCDTGSPGFNHGSVAADPPTSRNFTTYHDTGSVEGLTGDTGTGGIHTHAGSTTADDGAHTHAITLESVGLLPPYYALCFIMKIN